MLLPLALSHHFCRPVSQCSIFETVFLLLATVSAVNLLTTVLNDTPLMPDDDGIDIDWLVNSPDTSHWLQDDVDDDGPTKVVLVFDPLVKTLSSCFHFGPDFTSFEHYTLRKRNMFSFLFFTSISFLTSLSLLPPFFLTTNLFLVFFLRLLGPSGPIVWRWPLMAP